MLFFIFLKICSEYFVTFQKRSDTIYKSQKINKTSKFRFCNAANSVMTHESSGLCYFVRTNAYIFAKNFSNKRKNYKFVCKHYDRDIKKDFLRCDFGLVREKSSTLFIPPWNFWCSILPLAFAECSSTAVLFSNSIFFYFPSVYFIFINFYSRNGCCTIRWVFVFSLARVHVFPSRILYHQSNRATAPKSCWSWKKEHRKNICTTTFFISSLKMPDSVNISVPPHGYCCCCCCSTLNIASSSATLQCEPVFFLYMYKWICIAFISK